MSATYLALVVLCLLGMAIRTGYELLKQAGKVNTESKPIFAVVFLAMCTMLLSWPFLSIYDPSPIPFLGIIHWLGLLVLMVGLGLAFGGLIQLKGLENIDHLVTSGLYAKLRHPMYTGFILWILGWVIFRGAAVSFVVGLVCILGILFWRQIEERKLKDQFGQDYERYRQLSWF